ncbi:MAG: CoA transferase [Myxococcales bacterium]|nr:CoA transferase [Myxococcales bacterium]
MQPGQSPLPLEGVVVVDASRMLPGAVLARMLLDLGARVIKIEDPRTGDLMRYTPPTIDGIGVGFCVFFRGAESVTCDLRSPAGGELLRALAGKADVLIESFRPGTLDRWGLGLDGLRAANPALITVSLPGFASGDAVGHDLNFTAMSGLLDRLQGPGIPAVQLADCTAGTLACSAILAALLRRHRTGEGGHISQPLAQAPLQFMTWVWAEAATGAEPISQRLLGGSIAAYGTYRCGDGLDLAVGCLEPKFWIAFAAAIGLPELAAVGLDVSESGAEARAKVADRLSQEPRSHWLALVAPLNLPVSPVHDVAAALAEPSYGEGGLVEATPMPGGSTLRAPGPSLPSLGKTPERPAPRLGEHTRSALADLGVDPAIIDKVAGK